MKPLTAYGTGSSVLVAVNAQALVGQPDRWGWTWSTSPEIGFPTEDYDAEVAALLSRATALAVYAMGVTVVLAIIGASWTAIDDGDFPAGVLQPLPMYRLTPASRLCA